MPISTRDQTVAALARGATYFALKVSGTISGTRMNSMWTSAGFPCGNPGAPGATAVTCSSATRGALPMPAIATPGNRLYLGSYGIYSSNSTATFSSGVVLYDRAAHMGGIVYNITTTQTVGLSAPARLSSTVGYLPLLEWYSASSATSQTWTMSYTNSAGVAGRTGSLTIPTASSSGQIQQFLLQAGDVGVSSVETVRLTSSASAAAGQVAVVLAKPLVTGAVQTGTTVVRRNFVHMIDLGVDPCLFMAIASPATSQMTYSMHYTVMEG